MVAGTENTVHGERAGARLDTGYYNTLIGREAGGGLTDPTVNNTYDGTPGNIGNTFLGRRCAPVANGPLDCTGVGRNTMLNLTTAKSNAAIGANALRDIEGGSENAACGTGALQHLIGSGTFATGNGHRNSALGEMAGARTNTGAEKEGGKGNTYLGAFTTSSASNATNETVIGYDAEGRGTNTVVIGNANVTEATIAGVWRQPPLTVAALPSAATVGAGARGFVTDANATTFNSVVAGGGANNVPVFSDGASWRIG